MGNLQRCPIRNLCVSVRKRIQTIVWGFPTWNSWFGLVVHVQNLNTKLECHDAFCFSQRGKQKFPKYKVIHPAKLKHSRSEATSYAPVLLYTCYPKAKNKMGITNNFHLFGLFLLIAVVSGGQCPRGKYKDPNTPFCMRYTSWFVLSWSFLKNAVTDGFYWLFTVYCSCSRICDPRADKTRDCSLFCPGLYVFLDAFASLKDFHSACLGLLDIWAHLLWTANKKFVFVLFFFSFLFYLFILFYFLCGAKSETAWRSHPAVILVIVIMVVVVITDRPPPYITSFLQLWWQYGLDVDKRPCSVLVLAPFEVPADACPKQSRKCPAFCNRRKQKCPCIGRSKGGAKSVSVLFRQRTISQNALSWTKFYPFVLISPKRKLFDSNWNNCRKWKRFLSPP